MANNKIVFGNTIVVDVTSDTATADKVESGIYFMGKNGVIQTGSMGASGATVSGAKIIVNGGAYEAPSWSRGSDDDIIEAINLQHDGWIDLSQYWSVGDEREFELTDGNTVTLVLGTPLQGGVFSLIPKYATYKNMYMGTTTGTYDDNSTLRTWCNTTYYQKFSAYIRGIFRPAYNGTDYFYIPSVSEAQSVMGIKRDSEGVAQAYWTRTKPSYDRFYAINTSGNAVNYRGEQDPACAIPLGEI